MVKLININYFIIILILTLLSFSVAVVFGIYTFSIHLGIIGSGNKEEIIWIGFYSSTLFEGMIGGN